MKRLLVVLTLVLAGCVGPKEPPPPAVVALPVVDLSRVNPDMLPDFHFRPVCRDGKLVGMVIYSPVPGGTSVMFDANLICRTGDA